MAVNDTFCLLGKSEHAIMRAALAPMIRLNSQSAFLKPVATT